MAFKPSDFQSRIFLKAQNKVFQLREWIVSIQGGKVNSIIPRLQSIDMILMVFKSSNQLFFSWKFTIIVWTKHGVISVKGKKTLTNAFTGADTFKSHTNNGKGKLSRSLICQKIVNQVLYAFFSNIILVKLRHVSVNIGFCQDPSHLVRITLYFSLQ